MVIAGGLQAAFAKLGLRHPHENFAPYEPYVDPEPTRRIRRVSSNLSMRQRKPSLVQSACLSVHKIPAIVAVAGSPETPRTRPHSGTSRPVAARNRHSIAGAGWHQLLSPDDGDTRHALPKQTARANVDAPPGTRADRSHTVPAAINVPPSFDFCDRDQNKQPNSAPSQETTFRVPNIQVTAADRPLAETHHQHSRSPTTTSYDFVDMDCGSPAPLSAPRLSSPSQPSMRRSPSPAMGQSYRSTSPTVGHTPNYPGSQRRDSPLRTSHAPQRSDTPLQRPNSTSPAVQAAVSESYDFISMDQPSPIAVRENSEDGAYYCTSPTPIFTYGSTHGASRGNTYDSRRGDATRGSTHASTRDTYDPERHHGGATRMTYGQETGLTTNIGEIRDYNRGHTPRSVSAPSPSPTATISVDGTLDSPYFDRERDSTFPNPF